MTTETANALTGDNRGIAAASQVQIGTAALPNGIVNQMYAQTIACTSTSGPCAWQLRSAPQSFIQN